MKLYDGAAPTRGGCGSFLAEKGIELDTERVDIPSGGAKTPARLATA